jgi:hypothetical protein
MSDDLMRELHGFLKQDPLWASEDEIKLAPVIELHDPVNRALGILNGAVINFSLALNDVVRLLDSGPPTNFRKLLDTTDA